MPSIPLRDHSNDGAHLRAPRLPRVPSAPEQRRMLAAVLVIATLLVILYTPVLTDFVQAWLQYQEYNYAVFVFPIALFLLWRRWGSLRSQPLAPERRGALLLGLGIVMLLVGIGTGVHVAQGLSLIPVLLGLL